VSAKNCDVLASPLFLSNPYGDPDRVMSRRGNHDGGKF